MDNWLLVYFSGLNIVRYYRDNLKYYYNTFSQNKEVSLLLLFIITSKS